MKKKLLLISGIIIASTFVAYGMAEDKFKIYVNGAETMLNQIVENDTVYVPLRQYSNRLGYSVDWNADSNSITVDDYSYPAYKAVKKGDVYVYVDENGRQVFDDEYTYAMDFSDGMGYIQNSDYEVGFINVNGKVVIDGLYNATPFENGIAVVTEPVDETDTEGDSFTTDRELSFYFIDKAGNKMFDRVFPRAYPFSEGVACVQICGTYVPSRNEKNVYTYIDRSGEYATEQRFDYADSFKDGKAIVTKDGVRGYIDRNFEFHAE